MKESESLALKLIETIMMYQDVGDVSDSEIISLILSVITDLGLD